MKIPKFMNINPHFSKKKNTHTHTQIDHHNRFKTSYKHSINQLQRSILPNFIQLNKIPNLLKNTQTLISKNFKNHENFEIQA